MRRLLTCLCLAAAWPLAAQDLAELPVGTLTLPPGYTFARVQGIDSWTAEITHDSGFVIGIDQGPVAGQYADPDRAHEYSLIYRLQLSGNEAVVASKARPAGVEQYLVSYPAQQLNFYCLDPTPAQLAAFHAIALSFIPDSSQDH